jgi:hypothetical protein
MRQTKTILKWALPSIKLAHRVLAPSAEIFLRHSFGQRYTFMLIASFSAFTGYVLLTEIFAPPDETPLMGIYLLIFLCLLVFHIWTMFRTPLGRIQSDSCGQSHEFWERGGITPTYAQLFAEPAVTFLIGMLILHVDDALAVWLMLAGTSLFAKEVARKWRGWNRVLDALDARIDGEQMNTTVREYNTPQSGGAQAASLVTVARPHQREDRPLEAILNNLEPDVRRLVSSAERRASVTPNRTQIFHTGPLGRYPRITATKRT